MTETDILPQLDGIAALEARFTTAVVLFHRAVADELGLNLIDYKCLELMMRKRIGSPGELAREAGLPSASTTLILDRLERRGLLKREHDARDRRRVILKPAMSRKSRSAFQKAMSGMLGRVAELWSTFSPEDRAAIERYLAGAATALEDSLLELKGHVSRSA